MSTRSHKEAASDHHSEDLTASLLVAAFPSSSQTAAATCSPPAGGAAGSASAVAIVPAFRMVHESWDAFETELKEYCQATYQLYVVRSTTSVPRRNKRIATRITAPAPVPPSAAAATAATAGGGPLQDPMATSHNPAMTTTTSSNGSEATLRYHANGHANAASENEASIMIPDHFRWYSKSLVCTHGWKERHRSKGKRAVIAVRSTCCPAKMSVILQRNGDNSWQVVVTKHVRQHNHPLSKELFYHYCGNRRIFNPELLGVQGSARDPEEEDLEEDEPEHERTRVGSTDTVDDSGGNSHDKSGGGDERSGLSDQEEQEDVAMRETSALTLQNASSSALAAATINTNSSVATASSTETPSFARQVTVAPTVVAFTATKMPKEHDTWETFHNCFLEYTLRTNQQFRIRSTVSSAFQNSKLKEHSKRNAYDQVFVIPSTIKWFSKLYCCNHGWKRKSRSKAKHLDLRGLNSDAHDAERGKASSKPCPAMVLARVHCGLNGLWRVIVDRQHNVHNHPLEKTEQSGDEDDRTGAEARVHQAEEQPKQPNDAVAHLEQTDAVMEDAMNATSLVTQREILQSSREANSDLGSPQQEFEGLAGFDEDQGGGLNAKGEIAMRVPRIRTYHESWEAFHQFLDEYSAATFQSYRTRTTTSVRARNHRVCGGKDGKTVELEDEPDDEMQQRDSETDCGGEGSEGRSSSENASSCEESRIIPEHLRWYSKTMTCTHGWKERRRGTGKRVVQAIRSTECPVKICATLQYMFSMPRTTRGGGGIEFDAQVGPGWRVVVTKHVCDHNHNVSKELYQHYRENRRIYDPELLAIDESNEATVLKSRENDAVVEGSSASLGSPTSQHELQDEPMIASNVLLPVTESLQSTETSTSPTVSDRQGASGVQVPTTVTSASDSLANTSLAPYGLYLPPGVKLVGGAPLQQQQAFRQQALPFARDFGLSSSATSSPSGLGTSNGSNASLMMVSPYVLQPDALNIGALQSAMNTGALSSNCAQVPSRGLPNSLATSLDQEDSTEPVDGNRVTVKEASDGSSVWIVPHMQRKHDSWDSFEKYLHKYSAATFQIYRVRTTSSIAVRNARVYQKAAKRQIEIHQGSHLDMQLIPDSFVYYSKTYVCTHGWKERRRGKGQRVCHSLRSTSCPVKACVTLQRDLQHAFKWNLVVTKHVVEHNHELSEEIYEQYSENRRINDPELLAKVEQFWRSGMSRRRIYEYLVEHTSKKVRMKDVHNLIHRWQNQRSGSGEFTSGMEEETPQPSSPFVAEEGDEPATAVDEGGGEAPPTTNMRGSKPNATTTRKVPRPHSSMDQLQTEQNPLLQQQEQLQVLVASEMELDQMQVMADPPSS